MGVATFLRARNRQEQEGGDTSPPIAEQSKFVCPVCGKDCKIKMAYTNHVRACKGKHDEETIDNIVVEPGDSTSDVGL